MIELRRLKIEDAKLIYQWRNTKEIKDLSTSQKDVTWDEHLKWVSDSISNNNRLVFLINLNGKEIGQVRFDRSDRDIRSVFVSIYLIGENKGKRIGTQALRKAINNLKFEWPDCVIIYAQVREMNISSHTFFQNFGFKSTDEYLIDYHMTYRFTLGDDNNSENVEFYSELLSKNGDNVKSLNWGSTASQNLRFNVLAEIAELEGKSILDVGCGLGDLYKWLSNHFDQFTYTGYDITPGMIELCQSKYPDVEFKVIDILREDILVSFDYVLLSGVFTYQNETFLKSMVSKLFKIAKRGVAFNALSSWGDQFESNEYYADPMRVISHFSKLTKSIVFRHDYHPRDFTIYMYKEIAE